jgi:hypothetical protein
MKLTNKKTMKHKNMKNKNIKNKTIKNNNFPSLKFLKIGFPLFASKKFEGDKLLEFKRKEEEKTKDHCLLDNSSWFGSFNVAKSYKTEDTKIYKWNINKPTYLLKINKENESFINYIFKNTRIKLKPTINLNSKQIETIEYEHPYINMNKNEKALYEFKFAFGYITLEEQYEFLKLLRYLIENKFIEMETREGKNIIKKINLKINYYNISSILPKKEKYNRLSFYYFDKYAIMNLCKIVHNKKEYKISGVYQKNDTSFWFPNLIVYKMDIEEYILFNPHHNLVYDSSIE